MCFVPVRVVLSVGSASRFGHIGPGTRGLCKASNMLLLIISSSFCQVGAPPKRKNKFWSVGLPLGGSRAPVGANTRKFSEVMCYGSGGCSRRVSAPPTLESPITRIDLLQLGSRLALGRRLFLAQMGLALGKCAHFQRNNLS